MELKSKFGEGVGIVLEGDRKPGEKIKEYLAQINQVTGRITTKIETHFDDMRDDDKQLVEQNLMHIFSNLQDIDSHVTVPEETEE